MFHSISPALPGGECGGERRGSRVRRWREDPAWHEIRRRPAEGSRALSVRVLNALKHPKSIRTNELTDNSQQRVPPPNGGPPPLTGSPRISWGMAMIVTRSCSSSRSMFVMFHASGSRSFSWLSLVIPWFFILVVVCFQVSGPAQRRTRTSTEDRW